MARDYHIYAQPVDGKALDQFQDAMKQPFAIKGALMADAHLGYSLPIGGVIATRGVVVPAWVGYDIGCGMCAVPTSFGQGAVRARAREIFDGIYAAVPMGFKHNREQSDWNWEDRPMTAMLRRMFEKSGLLQLGSLGSGNHFIEIGCGPAESPSRRAATRDRGALVTTSPPIT